MADLRVLYGNLAIGILVLTIFPAFIRADPDPIELYDSAATPGVNGDIGFGKSSAISPDGNLLAVGCSSETFDSKSAAGTVRVFLKVAGGWVPVATLKSGSPSAGAAFGFAVAVTNDRVIGSAPYDSSSSGRIAPFSKNGSVWVPQTEITGSSGSLFGSSLSTDGTYLAAGASSFNSNRGLIYVYSLDADGLWAQLGTFTGSSNTNSYMGFSVSVRSGLVLAGAYGETSKKGAGYLWTANNNQITFKQRISTSLSFAAWMGYSAAVISNRMAALGSLVGSTVYIYTSISGTWSFSSALTPPNGEPSFGVFIGSSPGYLLVGSQGKAQVFFLSGDTLSSNYITLTPPSTTVTSGYGFVSLSMSGEFAVIADYSTSTSPVRQRAHTFRIFVPSYSYSRSRSRSQSKSRSMSKTPAPSVNTVVPPRKSKSKALGYKVAFWKNNAIISEPFCFDTAASCNGGYILLFQKEPVTSEWLFNTRVQNPFRNRDVKFGYNIFVNDNYLIASAPDSQYGDKNTGAIVFYKWNSDKNTFVKDSIIRYRKTDKPYALRAAITNFNNVTVIGIPEHDRSSTLTNTGAVHIFLKKNGHQNFWGQRKTITALKPKADERFGRSVSLQSDTRLAVSNNPTDPSLQAVYILGYIDDEWTFVQTVVDTARPGFGWNARFFSDLLYISAIGGIGSISVFQADAQGHYAVLYAFQPAVGVNNERFGYRFATDGARFVVSTKPCDDGVGCGTKGAVYTFTKSKNNKWTQQFHYALGAADGSDGFGFDVAVSGDTVLSSAPFKAISTRDGIAYFIKK